MLIKFVFPMFVDMSSTAFIEPLPVIDFVAQLLNRDVSARPLSDADRVKVCHYSIISFASLKHFGTFMTTENVLKKVHRTLPTKEHQKDTETFWWYIPFKSAKNVN